MSTTQSSAPAQGARAAGLPATASLLLAVAALIVFASVVGAWAGVAVSMPGSGELVTIRSLLSSSALGELLQDFPAIVGGFPVIPVVLLLLLAVGVAERTGFVAALMRHTVMRVPRALLTPAVLVAGTLAHVASDAAFIVVVPLGAVAFRAAGRHPVAGLCATFASVGAGGQLVITPTDGALLQLAETAAHSIDPTVEIGIAATYGFNLAFGVVAIALFWLITDRIVEPALGTWTAGPVPNEAHAAAVLGHWPVRLGLTVTLGVFLVAWIGTLRPGWPLYTPEGNGLGRAMTAVVFLAFLGGGVAYGVASRSVRHVRDVVAMMEDTLASTGGLLLILIVAALLQAFMARSNLGLVAAVSLVDALGGGGGAPLFALAAVVMLALVMDVAMPGAMSKWAMLAPVIVPSMMLLGWSPAMTTAAFRVGDAPVNIVNPLMAFMPLTLAMAQQYLPDLTLGRFLRLMGWYAVTVAAAMLAVTLLWGAMAWPPGPGATARYGLGG